MSNLPAWGTIRPDVMQRINTVYAARPRAWARIAHDLNAGRIPTAHGGAQWWPSTAPAILRRART
jgi:hypothetical protein